MTTPGAQKISFSMADPKDRTVAEHDSTATTTSAATSTMMTTSTSTAGDSEEEERTPPIPAKKNALVDTLRKGAVAVTGGTLTVVGLLLIPLPTPMGGCVVVFAGMTLLGTEFEAANRILAQAQESALAVRDKWSKNTACCTCQESDKDKDDHDHESFLSKNVLEPIRSARERWQSGTCGTSSPPPDDNIIHAAAVPA